MSRLESFFILAYRDSFCFELLAIWQVNVRSLHGIKLAIQMGQITEECLTLYSDFDRTVRLYSSRDEIGKI